MVCYIGISRKGLVLEMENVGVRCELASFEDGKDKIGRGQLECETLADQTSDLRLMLKGVEAGNNTSSAVTKQEERQARFPRFRQRYDARNITEPTSSKRFAGAQSPPMVSW